MTRYSNGQPLGVGGGYPDPSDAGDYLRGDRTWADLNKAAVGLGNVDNTSDANKPISTEVQSALNNKAALSHTHTASQITDFDAAVTALVGGGSGTVTSVATGTGLTGGPITTTGTVSIAANGVTYALLQQVAASSLVGNATGSLADATGITLGATLAFSGSALQTVAMTGDVTASANSFATTIASNAVTTAKIADANVTYAKVQNVAASRLLGNPTGGATAPAEISVGATFAFSGSALQTVAMTGDVTTSANSFATTIANSAVTFAKVATAAIATDAEYRSNTASKLLSAANVWSAADLVSLSDAATVAVDMSTGINFTVTLAGNRTLGNPTNTKVGQSGVIYVVQSGGSNTLAYSGNYKFAGGTAPVLSTAAGAVDRLTYFVRTSTHIDIDISKARA